MGFYNIYTEGQQADKYLADKARAQREKEKTDLERSERRFNKYEDQLRNNHQSKDPNYNQKKLEENRERVQAAADVVDRRIEWEENHGVANKTRAAHMDPALAAKVAHYAETDKPLNRRDLIKINHQMGLTNDIDAIEKHMRRHPDQVGWR